MSTAAITLTNVTTGRSWNYTTEPQVRTVARLYSIQHPQAHLRVTVNDVVVWERP